MNHNFSYNKDKILMDGIFWCTAGGKYSAEVISIALNEYQKTLSEYQDKVYQVLQKHYSSNISESEKELLKEISNELNIILYTHNHIMKDEDIWCKENWGK